MAVLPAVMFLPSPVLRPTPMLKLAFTRFVATFLTARAAIVPVNSLTARLMSDRSRRSKRMRHGRGSDSQQADQGKTRYYITHVHHLQKQGWGCAAANA